MAFTLPSCEQCGVVDHLLVDGYDFGDRLLESVLFEVRAVRGRPQVRVTDEDAVYFQTLNTTRWLREARRYVRDADMFICPHCESDVEVVAPASTRVTRVAVPVRTATVRVAGTAPALPTPPMTQEQKDVLDVLTKLFGPW